MTSDRRPVAGFCDHPPHHRLCLGRAAGLGDVFVSRSQPVPGGIRSPRRYVVVPVLRNGMANAEEAVPTTQPAEFTARPEPCVVPTGNATGWMPFACDQMNGSPEP